MFKDLNIKTKIYLVSIYVIAFVFVLFAFNKYTIDLKSDLPDIIFFAILSIISESLQVHYNNLSISTGFTITLSSVLILNPLATLIIISTGMAFRVLKERGKYYHILNTPFYKTLFNVSIMIISLIISTQVYELSGGIYRNFDINIILLPVIILSVVFFSLDYLLVCFLIHLWLRIKLSTAVSQNAKMGFLNIIGMVPFGLIIVEAYRVYGYLGILIIFGPIMLARYSFAMYAKMKKAYLNTVKALSLAIEAKDKYIEGHSERVVKYAEKIARKMHFSESQIESLRISSLLHDIGKIGIPEAILDKPGRLTDEEYSKIKEHPVIGANIVSNIEALRGSADVVRYHHEHYDGTGYPKGLSKDEVPMDAYIIAIADAFDAMCSDRPYRKAMTREEAIDIIKKERGKQFHPAVVDAFLEILDSEGGSKC